MGLLQKAAGNVIFALILTPSINFIIFTYFSSKFDYFFQSKTIKSVFSTDFFFFVQTNNYNSAILFRGILQSILQRFYAHKVYSN